MTSSHKVSSELSRDLSLFHITMMGLGMMIGAGVFLGTGKSIGYAGPGGVLLTFAFNGLIAIFTAMSYAELSSAIPRAGGAYNFARVGFGRGTSFIAGWMEWFASSVAGALYAVCCATYTVRFLQGLGLIHLPAGSEALVVKVAAVAIAGIFIYINYRGASETGKVGAIMTLAQTGFLLFIGVLGVWVAIRDPVRLENFKPFLNEANGGWSALLVTMGFTAVAFEGFEVIAQAGDETINPRQNVPKAMLYSVVIVTLTYVACAFATIVAVKAGPDLIVDGQVVAPWQWIGSHGGEGFGAAVERLLPRGGSLLVVMAVIFASTSALNATVYSATRASYALGRDRMLPGFFSRISKKTRTPWVALVFTGAIVFAVAGGLEADQVAASASIMFLLLFFLVNICVIRIRYNMGDELDYGFLMPLFPLLPILAIVCQGVLAIFLHEMGRTAWIVAPCWIGAGVIIYRCYSCKHALASEDEIQVIEEHEAVQGDEYRVMVAIANPDNALSLVRSTHAICKAKDARVELLHMVPVPDQIPLADADQYMTAGREAIAEVMLYLAPEFPFSSTLRYCRNVARGIVSAVREKRVQLLIMGWQGARRTRGFTLGSTIDPVLERVPCDVMVLKNVGDQKYKRVLVPVAGGPNSAHALRMASILMDPEQGVIDVLTVLSGSGEGAFDVQAFVDENVTELNLPAGRIQVRSVRQSDPVRAILDMAHDEKKGYDLVVLGATCESILSQFTRESVTERVAQQCHCPLAVVKASGRIRSWVRRWL